MLAVSRTCTAPVDRLKFLMIMAHPDSQTRLTVRQVRPLQPQGDVCLLSLSRANTMLCRRRLSKGYLQQGPAVSVLHP